jgi:hypothetical protein
MPAPAPKKYLETFEDHPLPTDDTDLDFSTGGIYTEDKLQVI